MAVIGYGAWGSTFYNDPDEVYNLHTTLQTWTSAGGTQGDAPITNNFYARGWSESGNLPNAGQYRVFKMPAGDLGAETWLRFCWMLGDSGWDNCLIAEFVIKPATGLVASNDANTHVQIGIQNKNMAIRYKKTLAGAWEPWNAIGPMSGCSGAPNLPKEIKADVRIIWSDIAGGAQLYNGYTYAIVGNGYSGPTCPAAYAPTHLAMYAYTTANHPYANQAGRPVYVVASQEKTFGMDVVPLIPKIEGTHQDQVAGTGIDNIKYYKRFPQSHDFVSMIINKGQTKNYTTKLENLTDVKLPADYTITAFQFEQVFSIQQSDLGQPEISSILKMGATDTDDIKTPVVPIQSNLYEQNTNHWQGRVSPMWLNNPKTNQPWQKADFDNIEVGYAATGA